MCVDVQYKEKEEEWERERERERDVGTSQFKNIKTKEGTRQGFFKNIYIRFVCFN